MSTLRLVLLVSLFLSTVIAVGCSNDYEPDPSDIPNIPPATRTLPDESAKDSGNDPLPPQE